MPPPPPASVVLPSDVVRRILVRAATLDASTGVRLLQLNRAWHAVLVPCVYARVELGTAHALATFRALVQAQPHKARAVRRLWIGPMHARSDLLPILSVPKPTDSPYLVSQRGHVYSDTRLVLRACRRVEDVALSGSLVSADVVHSYGTACQPGIITSINPHSFISAFNAPIFRRVHTLRVCDLNLSLSEVHAIRRMPALRSFTYTSPKDDGDVDQEVYTLRLLVTCEDDDPLEALSRRLHLDDTRLELIIRTAPQRAAQLAARWHEVPGVEMRTRTVPQHLIDAWDALRDLVFRAHDDIDADADPSSALGIMHDEWR